MKTLKSRIADAAEIGYVAKDLAKAGYYVVSVNYELARCGLIPGQICHEDDDPTPGAMVKRQTENIKAFVVALENDSHVDHARIGVVGGSAGGSHAMSVALDKTQSPNNGHDWPFWFKDGNDTRPKCAVMLSGVYDFSDRTPTPRQEHISSQFILGTENYVNSADFDVLKANSPIALATSDNTPFPSIFMINSYYDTPPPYHQMVEMICAFESLGFSDFQTYTIFNSELHSFQYWNSPDTYPATVDTPLMKDHVIAFLDAHLK
jgi:acetyl esterase/lipase